MIEKCLALIRLFGFWDTCEETDREQKLHGSPGEGYILWVVLYKYIHDGAIILQPRGYLAEPFLCYLVSVRSLVRDMGLRNEVLEILKTRRTIGSHNLSIILCKYRCEMLQSCPESFAREFITK